MGNSCCIPGLQAQVAALTTQLEDVRRSIAELEQAKNASDRKLAIQERRLSDLRGSLGKDATVDGYVRQDSKQSTGSRKNSIGSNDSGRGGLVSLSTVGRL
mmetsp:Transcript_65197/g.139590  ORF Transcript_65197/g.139590 Transcript_65197/m.139590 type:complete len:101 (+) Transcript_65197:112-414(+)